MTAFPTVRATVRAIDDAEELGGVVFHNHALRVAQREGFGMRLRATRIDRAVIGTLEYRAPVRIQAAPFLDSYQVNLPLFGGVRMRSGSREDVASSRFAVVHGPSAPTALEGWTEPARLLGLKVFRHGLEDALAHAVGRDRDRPIEFHGPVDLARPEDRAWATLARRLLWWSGGGEDGLELAERTLVGATLTTLLRAAPHDRTDELERADETGADAVARAVAIMHARIASPIAIPDVAAEVGVSTRTLEKRFQAEWGRSPAALLRDLRLEYAHRELSRAGAGAVSEVAARWGLVHAGRFAERYTERFGRRPSQTRAGVA